MEPTSENTYPLDSIKEGADEPVANDTCDVTNESNPGDMLHIPAEGNLLQTHYYHTSSTGIGSGKFQKFPRRRVLLCQYETVILRFLGESGVFHPDDVSSFYSNTKDFTHLQSKNIYAEPLNTLKATLSLTKRKFNLVDVSDFNPTFKEIELFTNQINSDIEVLADDRLFVEEQLMQAKENLVETTFQR